MTTFSAIINSVTILVLLGILWAEKSTQDSHWKATEHELNVLWDKVNEMEGKVITID